VDSWPALPACPPPVTDGASWVLLPVCLALGVCGLTWMLAQSAVAPLTVGGVAGFTGAVYAAWLRRSVRRSYEQPLQQVLEALRALRQGAPSQPLQETGAPVSRALVRSVNRAATTIDERTRQEQQTLVSVEAAFDRLHSVLQSLQEGVVVVDRDRQVVLANRCARRFLADGGRPIEGRRLLDLLGDDLIGAVRELFARSKDGPAQFAGVAVGDRICDLSLVQVRSSQTNADIGSVLVLVDVSGGHEVTKLKDDFLSSVSHEMRTPLTNITAFTEILGSMSPSNEKEWREFVGIIGDESRRLSRLVDHVLEYSRLESSKTSFQFTDVDATSLVRGLTVQFADAARGAGITLRAEAADGLQVHADAGRLNHVLSHLVGNGLKFAPRGGRITVQATCGGDHVQFSVDDDGPGVPADHRQSVFDKFHQVGDVMTDKPKGTGLGLAICRRTVDLMHGAIWCEQSELGGARFCFVLPKPGAQRVLSANVSGTHKAAGG
jgi:signal transduction histidine kinase